MQHNLCRQRGTGYQDDRIEYMYTLPKKETRLFNLIFWKLWRNFFVASVGKD